MAYRLYDDDIAYLLENNPSVAQTVAAHLAFVQANGWNQVANASRQDLPIPVWGMSFTDASGQYGRVIVYPDAAGTLHFLAVETATDMSVADEVDKPYYVSPAGSISDDVMKLLAQLNSMAAAAIDKIPQGLGIGLGLGAVALILVVVLALKR